MNKYFVFLFAQKMTENVRELYSDAFCDQKILAIKQDIRQEEQEFKSLKKERIIKWAELLENKALNGSYSRPIGTIAAHICQELRNMRCLAGMAWVYRVLDPRFKTGIGRPPNLTEDYDYDAFLHYKGNFIDLPDLPDPQSASRDELTNAIIKYQDAEDEYDKRYHLTRREKDELIEIALSKGWPIPGKSSTSERTPEPWEKFKGHFWQSTKRLAEAVHKWGHNLDHTLKNVETYPERDQQWDKEAARAVDALAETIETLAEIQEPYSDRKWAQDYPSWWRTQGRREDHGKHSAAVWQPISTIDGRQRHLTREQVGDRSDKLLRVQMKFSHALEGLDYWIRFAEWRKRGRMDDCIATRRDRVSPKLSESSFGSDKNV